MSDILETAQRVLALDREATEGPWFHDRDLPEWKANVARVGTHGIAPPDGVIPRIDAGPDAALIAEYRTAAPELAREVVALTGVLATETAERERCRDGWAGSAREVVALSAEVARLQSVANLAYEEKALADREFVASQSALAAERAKLADLTTYVEQLEADIERKRAKSAALVELLADARKRLDESWSVTPAEPTRMVATTFRPLSVREALNRYDTALAAGEA